MKNTSHIKLLSNLDFCLLWPAALRVSDTATTSCVSLYSWCEPIIESLKATQLWCHSHGIVQQQDLKRYWFRLWRSTWALEKHTNNLRDVFNAIMTSWKHVISSLRFLKNVSIHSKTLSASPTTTVSRATELKSDAMDNRFRTSVICDL